MVMWMKRIAVGGFVIFGVVLIMGQVWQGRTPMVVQVEELHISIGADVYGRGWIQGFGYGARVRAVWP